MLAASASASDIEVREAGGFDAVPAFARPWARGRGGGGAPDFSFSWFSVSRFSPGRGGGRYGGARFLLAVGGELMEALFLIQGRQVMPGALIAPVAVDSGSERLCRRIDLADSGV
jgi:hypothetical protein